MSDKDINFHLLFFTAGLIVFLCTKLKELYFRYKLRKKLKKNMITKKKYHIAKSANYKSPSDADYIEQCWNEVK